MISENVKILVAAHKPYKMPTDSSLYVPVQVGAALRGGEKTIFQPDSTGDNISCKNLRYCELTALYWGWKNLDCDVLGLAHYRRYLTREGHSAHPEPMGKSDILRLLDGADILMPRPRRYFVETFRSHYMHAHEHRPIEVCEETISENYPSYMSSWNKTLNSTSGHLFNMFVMRKSLVDDYCTWLFHVLSMVDEQVDMTKYSAYETRAMGFLGELLLDVWVKANRLRICEVSYFQLENQNWPKKIAKFGLRTLGWKPMSGNRA